MPHLATSPTLALVGCGNRLTGLVNLVLKADPGLGVRWVCDADPVHAEAIRQRFSARAVAPDLATCIDDPDTAWVLIGTFNADHAGIATRALEAGKAVFCEKPLATTLADTRRLIAARHRSNRPFAVGFNLRYAPFYRRLHEQVSSGVIGRILSLEFNETLDPNHGAAMHGNWRRHRERAGSFLMEKCCHDLDICNWLVGDRVRRVASFGGLSFFTPWNSHHRERLGKNAKGIPYYDRGRRTGAYVGRCENVDPFTSDKDVVDHQVAILEYENGVRASFHLNAHAAIQERRFYILGTEGAIRGDLLQGTLEVKRTGWDTQAETLEPGTWDGHGGGDAVLARELAEVMRGERVPATPFEAGLAATLTGLALDEALDTGQVVDLAPYWTVLNQPDAECGDVDYR